MTRSYDYAHRAGVHEITWSEFGKLAAKLAERIAAHSPDIVVGIARAGLFPATAVACSLRRELYPVRVTRRVDDRVTFDHPVWRVDVPAGVAGQRVVVVDEMADSGETLALVAGRVRERGAAHIITASLIAHSWAAPAPQVTALVTDAFVIYPWDAQVYMDGVWCRHPEIVEGLRLQGLE